MANQKGGPDREFLQKADERGLTAQQAADLWYDRTGVRVSRAAISVARRRYNLPKKIRRHEDLLPWSPMRSEHLRSHIAQMLRLEDSRRAGADLSHVEQRRIKDLDSWLARLHEPQPEAPLGLVVTYIRDTLDGFYYVAATPDDFKGLAPGERPVIRKPEQMPAAEASAEVVDMLQALTKMVGREHASWLAEHPDGELPASDEKTAKRR